MKKIVLFPLLFLFCLPVNCQTPTGKLFVHLTGGGIGNPQTLGYIQYPSTQHIIIDTTSLSDMVFHDNMIYIADGNIYGYDIFTNSITDSILNVDAFGLDIWNDYLVVTSTVAPFFRVYNINNNYSLVFSLDSNKVDNMPADIGILYNRAYLAHQSSLQIVDLNQQDTVITLPTPHPFQWAGYNQFVIVANNDIYIDVEYATGVPRFSLLKLNQQTLTVDSVFHREMEYNPYKPVVGNNLIYVSYFNSHYNITLDTLITATYNYTSAIEFDTVSDCVFVYDMINSNIYYSFGSTTSQTFGLPSYLNKALFVPANITHTPSVCEGNDRFLIYPNPAFDNVNIRFNIQHEVQELHVYNYRGVLLKKISFNQNIKNHFFNISDFPDGCYFVKAVFSDKFFTKGFLKVSK